MFEKSPPRFVLAKRAPIRLVTLAEVKLQDGQQMLAFNDLFVGVRSHVSARYKITVSGRTESQSSSGVLVSTGAGSTGWMSSVFNMAAAGSQGLKGENESSPRVKVGRLHDCALWAVREPFISRDSQAELVCGILSSTAEMVIESMTPENGVIFSDGIEVDALEFNAGTIAKIKVAAQKARLVVSLSHGEVTSDSAEPRVAFHECYSVAQLPGAKSCTDCQRFRGTQRRAAQSRRGPAGQLEQIVRPHRLQWTSRDRLAGEWFQLQNDREPGQRSQTRPGQPRRQDNEFGFRRRSSGQSDRHRSRC